MNTKFFDPAFLANLNNVLQLLRGNINPEYIALHTDNLAAEVARMTSQGFIKRGGDPVAYMQKQDVHIGLIQSATNAPPEHVAFYLEEFDDCKYTICCDDKIKTNGFTLIPGLSGSDGTGKALMLRHSTGMHVKFVHRTRPLFC